MAKDTVYDALQGLGFGRTGLSLYGTWGGYPLSVSNRSGNFFADVAVRLDKSDKQIAKDISAAMKQRGLPSARCVNFGDHLQFLLKFNSKTSKQDQFRDQINQIIDQIKTMGIKPAATCAVCGAGNPECLCFNGETYQPVHRHCAENTTAQVTKEVEENKNNGSYLLGIIGAILGAIVGLIPSVITIIAMEMIYALLFALVPVCAAFGYRKLGGKKNVGMIVIVVILSLLSVFILQFLVAAYYVADGRLGSIGTAFAYVVSYYMNPEGLGYIISNSIQEFIFMVIGIVVAWRFIGVTNNKIVGRATALLDTLRPNPGFNASSTAQAAAASQVRAAENAAVSASMASWEPQGGKTAAAPVQPSFAPQNVPAPAHPSFTQPQSTWEPPTTAPGAAKDSAGTTWQSGASFEADGKNKSSNGFDV